MGTPYNLRVTAGELDAPVTAATVMQMGQYVNPDLTNGSDYFRSLDSMMKCVEKNIGVTDPAEQERVCSAEFKNLRLAALNNKLFYSEVNKRWFMRELQWRKNYSGY